MLHCLLLALGLAVLMVWPSTHVTIPQANSGSSIQSVIANAEGAAWLFSEDDGCSGAACASAAYLGLPF